MIANTNKQPLDKHLLAVGYLTRLIYEKLNLNTENNDNMKVACYTAGLFHDIGKIDPNFQDWIKKKLKSPDENSSHQDLDKPSEKTWDNIVRHNEISWLICKLIAQTNTENGIPCLIKGKYLTDPICYGVYWHHEEKIRNKNKESSLTVTDFLNSLKKTENWDILLESFKTISNSLKKTIEIKEVLFNLNEKIETLDSKVPNFKTLVTQTDINNSLIRACLIEADRKISKLSCDELIELFDEKSGKIKKEEIEKLLTSAESKSSLKDSIEKKIKELEDKDSKYYNEDRNKKQLETANSLAKKLKNNGYAILQGPAGVGKTNISLMTAKEQESCKKIIYICPRVQVCQQNYNAIKQELSGIKTQIFTGEYKFVSDGNKETEIEEDDFLNADVVITTIDQISSLVFNHLKSPKLLSLLDKSTLLVFDEFHELFSIPGHYPPFKEIVNVKRNINNGCGVLFMSATPNPIFLSDVLSLNENNKPITLDIIKIESFNTKPVTIKFTEELILSDKLNPREIAIYNIIDDLQNDFIINLEQEDSLVYHSKFTNNDKKIIFDDVIKYFGKDSINENNDPSLRSGPILQASLDISSDILKTQETSPENFLQRIGRCNRWGFSEKSEVVVVLNKRNKKGNIENLSQKKYLEKNYCLNTTLAFGKFLEKENKENKEFKTTVNNLYELYFKFIEDNKGEYEKDLEFFKEEVESFYEKNAYFRPVHYFNKNKKKKSANLAKISLRGLSIYALPAKVVLNENTKTFDYEKNNNEDYWLWKPVEISKQIEEEKELDTSQFLTVSKEDYDILDLVDQFKSKILKSDYKTLYKKDSYTKYNQKRILDMANSPETPLLISDPIKKLNYEKDFGYWFGYDKNKSRFKGLGLVMIPKKEKENKEGQENE